MHFSAKLIDRCKKTFINCDEFDDNAHLKTLFIGDLEPYRNKLRAASSKDERVAYCVDYLARNWLSDRRSALLVFTLVIKENYQDADARKNQLAELARNIAEEADRIGVERLSPTTGLTPKIEVGSLGNLLEEDRELLRRIYRGFARVLIEKEFGGGYSGTRVLLTLPIRADGVPAARKITKLGPAPELRREMENFERYVRDALPFCIAQVEKERYQEDRGRAGLNYAFVGGGALGQAMDLEEYYGRQVLTGTVERVTVMLENLLNKDMGQRWYSQTKPLQSFFAAEYGQRLVEHLRLRLRPASGDVLWTDSRPQAASGYPSIGTEAITHEYRAMRAGTLVAVDEMIIARIKHDGIKLEDPDGQGAVVWVEMPSNDSARRFKIGDRVGVRGQVVYNRGTRMEQIASEAFPGLVIGEDVATIQLPNVQGTHPNPLSVFPGVLNRILEGRQSCVHGDLHLRNIVVDESAKGWLIDFARVGDRHNLYDFIKLETYVRLMALGSHDTLFSLGQYVLFEHALTIGTLDSSASHSIPTEPQLVAAYKVILAIRNVARNYMAGPDFRSEYLPALFLYCLAVTKYFEPERPRPTQLAIATAAVLGEYV